ncbi:MAG: sensor domain-containing protein [Streptosporangiaceae bacterium]
MTPLQLVRDIRVWKAAVYLPLTFGLGLGWFVVLVAGVSASAALLIVWVGLLGFALLATLLRGGSMLDRRLIEYVYGERIADPYRPVQGRGLLGSLRIMATDPGTWKDLAYQVVRIPLSFGYFVGSAVMWSFTAMCLTSPLLAGLGADAAQFDLGFGRYEVTSVAKGLPLVPVGVAAFLVSLYVVKVLSLLDLTVARALLGPNEKQSLKAQTVSLKASRARGVDAAEAERRRIERDLHDGAQQQLLAVAMNIGRARSKMESDPEGARQLIEQAHSGTRAAIAELRDLARGIYPAILTDRGLDAALSALAARAPVPVAISVDLAERPPAVVESIAYFTVAESLTNVAKYAQARQVAVQVVRTGDEVTVEVRDDGAGGARLVHGGGLEGLADRAATIDGKLTVDSPPGGPTVVRAVLPCSW